MFRNLKKTKIISIEKRKSIKIKLTAPFSFLTNNCSQLLFLKSTFCTNYIPMYIMRRPIRQVSKLQHQNYNYNGLPKLHKLALGI